MNGAKALRLDGKVGSLTPGKEADIIILDATRINVAPLDQVPGAVVSLMDRTNVETVIAAGEYASGRVSCSTSTCQICVGSSRPRGIICSRPQTFVRTCSAASDGKSMDLKTDGIGSEGAA
jgi:hypothetical protein